MIRIFRFSKEFLNDFYSANPRWQEEHIETISSAAPQRKISSRRWPIVESDDELSTPLPIVVHKRTNRLESAKSMASQNILDSKSFRGFLVIFLS